LRLTLAALRCVRHRASGLLPAHQRAREGPAAARRPRSPLGST